MENPNEDQDQMSTSSSLTGSSGRSVPVEDVHVEFSELSNVANATGSNERVTDQASNAPGDGVAPHNTNVIGDINCEVDTEVRHQRSQVNGNQPPVMSETNMTRKRIPTIVVVFAWKMFRKRTVNGIDYPAALTSSKQPSTNDDVSDTWENHPLQTFPQHSKMVKLIVKRVLSLCCEICGKEEVFMKSLCCNSEYHQDCFNQCREEGHTNCLYCRCPMQEGGRRNGGGEDNSGSNGGGRGRGGGGLDGGRVDDDAVGENNNGGGDGREGDDRGGDDRGGDEGDPGGGGDDDGGCGGGGGGCGEGSPLPSQPPPPSPFLQLLFLPLNPLLFPPQPPSADDGDEEEDFERRVDYQGGNENSASITSPVRELSLRTTLELGV
ncbi:hypothetical protein pdam_00004595 [Pocillopora damicornis]|uniref:Uncharacterized protein n=1 Tax=Pocillopora damicornis TaxID=46731 RepID=A0A3M6ULS9_POCDA|nr:hypothetical protein pdam_00004595 [Pocillopora damicornis]